MITDLDSPSGLDPVRVGGKAAALAAAKAAGAAVLDGFVVDGSSSVEHMLLGAATLPGRGSGGARLAVSGAAITFADDLVAAGARLGDSLVARSSTLLETSGEWSGAFASYVDITPPDLPRAVVGCWSSAFSVAALERQDAAGIEPGSFPMSVLVQPALEPRAGGWATQAGGIVEVHGIEGPPAPLLQGWATGHSARYDGTWHGDELVGLLGIPQLEAIRELLETVERTGANRCEWALADRIWALQVGRGGHSDVHEPVSPRITTVSERLVEFARTLVMAPGPLGERLVLPWALGGVPETEAATIPGGDAILEEALELSARLTEEVWAMPREAAFAESDRVMSELRGPDPSAVLPVLDRLGSPDPGMVTELLGRLRTIRHALVEREVVPHERVAWHLDTATVARALAGRPVPVPTRIGIGRWEPLVATVVLSGTECAIGTPAAGGVGAGRRAEVADPFLRRTDRRVVVSADQPLPNLASLLWDAAGLVTASGSPAAHLFESARALRVPAVCGVRLARDRDEIAAVDGYTGRVGVLALDRSL